MRVEVSLLRQALVAQRGVLQPPRHHLRQDQLLQGRLRPFDGQDTWKIKI